MRAFEGRRTCDIARSAQPQSDLYYYIARLQQQNIIRELYHSMSDPLLQISFPEGRAAIPTELAFDLSAASKLENSAYRVKRYLSHCAKTQQRKTPRKPEYP